MRYSLTKIAQELGLSKTTVSLILNGRAREMRISRELECKVKEFCEEVNYVPNIHAQRINQRFVKNIGFLMDSRVKVNDEDPFADPNMSGIMGGIVLAAEEADYRVSIQLYTPEMNENKVFDWLRNNEIDGLIYYGLDLSQEWRKIFFDEDRKVVGIGIEPDDRLGSVNIDHFGASACLTEHLIKRGKRNFSYVAGGEKGYVSNQRMQGFLAAIKAHRLYFDKANVITANYSERIAEEYFLNNTPETDAVVCANDDMAIGVIRALQKKQIAVPQQIAVAGADNIPLSRYIFPSLTTFDNKPKELGKTAFGLLWDMIRGAAPQNIVLPSEVYLRDSI